MSFIKKICTIANCNRVTSYLAISTMKYKHVLTLKGKMFISGDFIQKSSYKEKYGSFRDSYWALSSIITQSTAHLLASYHFSSECQIICIISLFLLISFNTLTT